MELLYLITDSLIDRNTTAAANWQTIALCTTATLEIGLLSYLLATTHKVTKLSLDEQVAFIAPDTFQPDPLTQLPNRKSFDVFLKSAVEMAKVHGQKLAVLFIDLDGFKPVNDTFGHAVGDEVLRIVSARLMQACPRDAFVSRIGGDEFLIALTGFEDRAALMLKGTQILESIQEEMRIGSQDIRISASVGIAQYPDGLTPATLVECADMAMYKAKHDKVRLPFFYSATLGDHHQHFLQLSVELKKAIENNELDLHLQPQYSSKTKILVGAECLLRWNHPTEGIKYPQDFLEIAQRFGLAIPLTEWTLRRAGALQRQLNQAKMPLTLSLNFSGLQVRHEHFIQLVKDLLEQHCFQPSQLYFEMNESTLAPALGNANELVAKIVQLGIGVTLDDFGGGSMGIQRLKDLQIQKVRISRSFSTGIGQVPAAVQTAQALVALAHALNIQVGLKEIETSAQVAAASEVGADELQGYALCKPLPIAKFLVDAPVLANLAAGPTTLSLP